MINLAKQNQYVEFAEKDSEGHNIAEKIDELDSKPTGTKLYRHLIRFSIGNYCMIQYISTIDTPVTTWSSFFSGVIDDIYFMYGTNYPQIQYYLRGSSANKVTLQSYTVISSIPSIIILSITHSNSITLHSNAYSLVDGHVTQTFDYVYDGEFTDTVTAL